MVVKKNRKRNEGNRGTKGSIRKEVVPVAFQHAVPNSRYEYRKMHTVCNVHTLPHAVRAFIHIRGESNTVHTRN
jgi:hypothetical protein